MRLFLLPLVALSIVDSVLAASDGRTYNTTKAMVEINDPKAERNPIRSISAPNWKALEVKAKLRPKGGQDISIACEGNFPAGFIADDLYSQSGRFNRRFVIDGKTTVMDLCNQQEDIMRKQNPRQFK